MKKTVIGIIIGILIVLSSYIVSAPAWYGTGDDSGLVGRWSCEGNFKDSSGQGNHGTQSGGVTITSGVKGRGCSFDGVNDYVQIAHSTGLEPKNITISTWVKLNNDGNRHIVLAKWSGYTLEVYSTYIVFQINNAQGQVGTNYGSAISWGDWHHLAGTFNDETKNISIYIDGTLVNSTTLLSSISYSQNVLRLSNTLYGDGAANGSIDEVRIYNRSLSATEISDLYNTSKTYYFTLKTTPVLGGLNDTPAPTSSNEAGLMGYWKLDDYTNGNTTDSSGQGNNGSVLGAVFNSGRWGSNGYLFNGSTGYIDTMTYNGLNLTSEGSFSAWVKPSNIPADSISHGIGRVEFGDGTYISFFKYSNNVLYIHDTSGGTPNAQCTSTGLTANTWHHYVGTWKNGSAMSVYLDGALVCAGSVFVLQPRAMARVKIGMAYGNALWNGSIDEVRVYNRSLSADEVKELYISKGLVEKLSFDKQDGSNSASAIDTSGYYANGVVSGATFTNEGKFKEAYKFDGVNDNIATSTSANLCLGNTNKFTYAIWVKRRGQTSRAQCIGLVYSTSAFTLEIDTSNRIYSWMNSVNEGWHSAGSDDTQWSDWDNAWHHVAMTYNNDTNTVKYYRDGIEEYSNSASTTGPLAPCNTSALWITGQNNNYFNGTIDEVRIYNRALSASEIANIYNGTKTNYFTLKTMPELGGLNDTPSPTSSNETGLVGYWKMDDLTNGNTTDSSGQNNNGSVIGATFNSGRWDKGYSFDGTNDYVKTTNIISLNENFSVSLWCKRIGVGVGVSRLTSTWAGSGGVLDFGFPGTDILSYYFMYTNGTTTGWVSTGLSPCNNAWGYIALVSNNTGFYIYSNGVLGYNNTGKGLIVSNKIIYFGNEGLGTSAFNGTIDEVRIYNRSLSADEVKELYLSKGLVGYWKFDADQKNSTSTFDTSGYYNHGLITGATLTNEGRFKEAYKFDGVNDYINVGTKYPEIKSALTISTWVKPSTTQVTYADIWGNHQGDFKGIVLQQNAANINEFYWAYGNGTGWVTSGNFNLTASQWQQVTTVKDSQNCYTYINGIEKTSARIPCPSDIVPATTDNFRIGLGFASGRYFNGTIDEVKIYNRALTSTEIAQLYNGTKTNYFTLKAVAG